MVIFAWHAALFGSSLLGGELANAFRTETAVEVAVYGWFGLIPPVVVGAVFVVAAAYLTRGVIDRRRAEIRRAAAFLLAAWVYTWLAIPVANAVDGVVLASAFGRYSSPLPVAWWAYTRASYQSGWLGPNPSPRRPLGTAVAAAVVAPTAIVGVLDAVLLQTTAVPGGQLLEPALWTGVGVVLTAVLGFLGTRFASKKDLDKEMGAAAIEHTQFLFGQYGSQPSDAKAELLHTRGQLSEALRREEERERRCRQCPTYPGITAS